MGMYNYKARNVSGQLLQGTIEADNEKALASKLSTQGLMLIKSEELKKKTAFKESMSRFKKVSLKSISIFARQFSTMIDAGVSLVKCLDVLSQQIYGMAISRIWKAEEMLKTIRKSYCYSTLSKEDFMSVISYLSGDYDLEHRNVYAKIWYDSSSKQIGKRGKLARLIYLTNIGTIPEEGFISVVVG